MARTNDSVPIDAWRIAKLPVISQLLRSLRYCWVEFFFVAHGFGKTNGAL